MSEMLDVYAAEAEARKYRDMAATEFLTSHGYKWERYEWVAPDGLTPRQLAKERAELLEALRGLYDELERDHYGAGYAPEPDEPMGIAKAALATQQRNGQE